MVPLFAQVDPYCPAYPASQRAALEAAQARVRTFYRYSATRKSSVRLADTTTSSGNLIDGYIFGKMQSDGVASAPMSNDSEFVRRVYLDLTGRLPTVDQAVAFLNSADPNKRSILVEQLLESGAYVDKWTLFYANLFQVTSNYYNFITVQARNLFNQYLREFVSNDRSWADVARELITASGDSHLTGPPNFIVRSLQQNSPIQDTWDTLINSSTVSFLGVTSLCISCHDGRGHLEQINLYLAPKKRTDFWKMGAFVSRMNMIQEAVLPNFTYSTVIADRSSGSYITWVDPNNPGPRPARTGGPIVRLICSTAKRPRPASTGPSSHEYLPRIASLPARQSIIFGRRCSLRESWILPGSGTCHASIRPILHLDSGPFSQPTRNLSRRWPPSSSTAITASST